ncbi:MAG: TolC family protein [Bacteroidota bacterium]|nr:TolC family protein [Bacteroidota bacterium]
MNKKLLVIILVFAIPLFSIAQNRDLNYFIDNSVINNPLSTQSQNLILANSIDSQLIVAANKFQITGNGNAYYAPVLNGYGYDAAITNGQQLSALVAITKQINNKRNLGLQFKDLQLQKDSLNISSAISRQDIRKAIVNQYIITYGDQLQLDFNDEVINLLTNEEAILKKLAQQNVYKQADYLSFLVTLQQQQLTRNQLFVQYKNNYATLNYLAGIIDTTTATLNPPDIEVVKNFDKANSPFFLNYKIDSLRILNQRSIVDVGYRPKINLFADAGYQSSFILTPYKNFGYNVGINLSIPIYDGHQKQLQYSKLNIAERTREKQKEFFSKQFQQQIQQLEQQLNDLNNLAGPINQQIKYLQTLIQVNGKLLETGDIKITDYVLALNNYITSKNLVVQNKIARYFVIHQLNYWNLKQ